jgi:SNF2 family DNA or RNA helicase
MNRNKKIWSYLNGVFSSELTEESPRFDTPLDYIKSPLYIHQQALLASALALEKTKLSGIPCADNSRLYTNYGVLADRVGSGKSLVALSIIRQEAPPATEIHTAHRRTNLALVKNTTLSQERRKVKAALFVVPHSLMGQWEDYVTRDTTLDVIFCKRKKEAFDASIKDHLDSVDAVFISSTMYKEFDQTIRLDKIQWSRIFVDEADSITLQMPDTLSANFIWLITASYLNIAFPTGISLQLDSPLNQFVDNFPTELHDRVKRISGNNFRVNGSITNAHFIKNIIGITDYFKNEELCSWLVVKRNSEEFIDMSFKMPEIQHHKIICRSTANIRILESLIPNEVMEMLHAGDTKGALQSLGVKDETPTSIMNSLTRTLRRELEQQNLRLEFYKTQDYSSEAAKLKSLEAQQVKIKSLESRIETIEERMKNFANTNCPICYSDVETPCMTPCCKNLFCFVCLCESLKRQPICPLCREGVASINDIHVINNSAISPKKQDSANMPRTKIEEFISFVESNPSAKVLLFSGYDATFFQLTSELAHRNISHTAINGSTARVQKIINEFSSGNFRVLLLNSKHVGSGLNIVSATDVFLFHKMNSEMEKQIIGRAYRMGRKETLHVHHLLHNSEV